MSVTAHQLRPEEVNEARTIDALDLSMARLKKAIDGLEVTLHRREGQRKSAKVLEEELQVLFQDRARLAHELDHVKAKAAKLDAVSAEVAGRLDSVISNIGSVLGGR